MATRGDTASDVLVTRMRRGALLRLLLSAASDWRFLPIMRNMIVSVVCANGDP